MENKRLTIMLSILLGLQIIELVGKIIEIILK